ncbi:MAG TPA: glycosyltransferase [Acidimicrobiales bacterium]|nr:glycosyltransferase [Acidimicrobiales bacterium]
MTDRPRVVRLITRLNVGGPARQALLLTRDLADRFDTVLAAGRPTAVEGELHDDAVTVRRVPLVRPTDPVNDGRALMAVRRLLAQTAPDLVHTHMAKAGTIGRVAARSMRDRPRTVHTFHGHVLEGYFRPSTQRAFVEVERRLARQTDALVAVSPEIRDALLDLRIGRPAQFHVISLGFDLSSFLTVEGPAGTLRAKLGLAGDVPLVGIVGRLVPIKDVPTMLAAMVELPEAHLAVVGDGEMRPALEERARQLGIASRVHFTGWWPEVAEALSDLDVVALTSRNEGTPVSLIEAQAAGRPVVATDVGGVRYVVEEGVGGHVVPPGDARALAGRIARLLGDPGLRRDMGEKGRASVRHRFGKDALLSGISDLYTGLLDRRRPRR